DKPGAPATSLPHRWRSGLVSTFSHHTKGWDDKQVLARCGSEVSYREDGPMDQLWAPWRQAYVTAAKPPTSGDDCFLCAGLADNDDRKHLIALRTPQSVVMLNRFPYNNGHLLIAPRAHKGRLDELTSEELLETMETLRHMVRLL